MTPAMNARHDLVRRKKRQKDQSRIPIPCTGALAPDDYATFVAEAGKRNVTVQRPMSGVLKYVAQGQLIDPVIDGGRI
jgi:hypothetical protein